MTATQIIILISAYFALLLTISYITSRNSNSASFFIGNKKSPWFIVAFGMIGASLSGVTFISVPGWVGSSQMSYMQIVLGYLLGYFFIANVLMPMYYKLNLTSIYTYLEKRFGNATYKTGASFFLLSRVIGASFRLFLVANVLQLTVFDSFGIPFYLTVIITIVLIWIYTFKAGIKTIIWTDTLQTLFMLSAVGLSVYYISDSLNLNLKEMINTIADSEYSKTFFFDDVASKKYFFKQFISGAFISIVMTGLDQDMMQKNLSCKNIKDAKKNMYWFSAILVPVNLLFLALGVLLYIYSAKNGIELPVKSDNLFPMIATKGFLPPIVSGIFILGLIAAAYSSADSALTSLTTSFTIDILGGDKKYDEKKLNKTRILVHVGFSIILIITILIFNQISNESVISELFTYAGFTYGPLLGLYTFGLFTKLKVKDALVPIVAIASPIICFFLYNYSQELFGYQIGFEILIINGAITFLGLLIVSLTIPADKE